MKLELVKVMMDVKNERKAERATVGVGEQSDDNLKLIDLGYMLKLPAFENKFTFFFDNFIQYFVSLILFLLF